MKISRLICFSVVASFFVLGNFSEARAQLKFPNPFNKKPEANRYTLEEDPPAGNGPVAKGPGVSLPKLPKINFGGKPQQASKPSRMAKFNQGTKNFFTGVKRFLTPWNKDNQGRNGRSGRASNVTGTQRVYDGSPSARTAARQQRGDKPRFKFPSLFGKKDEGPQKPPSDLTQFLKQERPSIE